MFIVNEYGKFFQSYCNEMIFFKKDIEFKILSNSSEEVCVYVIALFCLLFYLSILFELVNNMPSSHTLKVEAHHLIWNLEANMAVNLVFLSCLSIWHSFRRRARWG